MRYGFLFAFALILISGCATQSDFERKHTDQEIMQMYRDRGEMALCVQADYQKCINLTEKSCAKRSLTFKDKCITKADAAAEKKDSSRAKRGAFEREFGKCMASHELAKHPDDMMEVASCFKTVHFDQKLVEEAISK